MVVRIVCTVNRGTGISVSAQTYKLGLSSSLD